MPHDWQTGAFVVQNVTYGELRPLVPADGDNYVYAPQPWRQPLIPPQWVPISEYHALVAEVQRMRAEMDEMKKLLDAWKGD